MSEPGAENGFDRLDRKIGTMWSRFWGVILAGAAALLTYTTVTEETFSVAGSWPMLLIAGGLALWALACFRSKESMLSLLSDVSSNKKP